MYIKTSINVHKVIIKRSSSNCDGRREIYQCFLYMTIAGAAERTSCVTHFASKTVWPVYFGSEEELLLHHIKNSFDNVIAILILLFGF